MGYRINKKILVVIIVVLVAVVPSVWLALMELRTSDHLVDEVERGLRTDAELFVDRLAQYIESRVYEENARGAVESTGFLVADTTAPSGYAFNIAYDYSIPGIVEYPFFIDFADSTVYVGENAKHKDEVTSVFALDSLYNHVPDYYGFILRGYTEGPYGPFHYVYTFDMVGATSDIILRGVKLNPSVVKDALLKEAYKALQENITNQRGSFPGELFGIEIETPDRTIVLSRIGALLAGSNTNAVRTYEASFDPGGIFANWTARVHFYNQLRAQRPVRYLAILIPLLIVVGGVIFAVRTTLRELELSRAKSAFVSNVSHELKTPLAKIRFFNEMLRNGRASTEEKRLRYFDVIEQECERLTLLLENVLDFSRIERGQLTYDYEDGDLREVVADILDTFSLLYQSRGYELDAHLGTTSRKVRMDSNAIKQAIINLLDNAVKYSEPHTIRVQLHTEHRNGTEYAAVSIIDRGIGIPETKVKHIFREFYRVDNGLSQRVAGSGLGLALVKHIVDGHNGVVEVESKEGVGSTFRLLLPLIRASETERREPQKAAVA